jgi:FkbM family methyltransferase
MIVRAQHPVYGHVAVLDGDKAIGEHILHGRTWEPHLTIQLDRILPSVEGYCLDIGAHIGLHSMYMANLGKSVIAFEPQPLLFSILVENIVANQHTILPIQKLMTNHDGDLTMAIPKCYDRFQNPGGLGVVDSSFSHPDLVVREFPCSRLDSLHLGNVGFIKIDVEGHEMEVLQGACGLLERDRPILIIELFGGCDRREYAEQIEHRIHEIQTLYGYSAKYIGGCDYLCMPE